MTSKEPLIQELWEKVKNLKEGQVLETAFGPENLYTIKRLTETTYLFSEKSNWREKILRTIEWESSVDIAMTLNEWPEMYAQNVFTRENKHMDNWVNMVKAFKIKNQ